MVFAPKEAYKTEKHFFYILCVSNGVEQGGIIFPVPFNVSMDYHSCALKLL